MLEIARFVLDPFNFFFLELFEYADVESDGSGKEGTISKTTPAIHRKEICEEKKRKEGEHSFSLHKFCEKLNRIHV